MKTKPKLATSYEIYSRIIWDNKIDKQLFWIGYIDRVAPTGVREKFLLDWDAEGDIPWHRVIYIRCNDVYVWDREKRIDLFEDEAMPAFAWLDAENETQPVVISNAQNETYFTHRPSYYYHKEQWNVSELTTVSMPCDTLKLITWNVLKDDYKPEIVQTEKRIPAILEHLRQQDADVIALQEVNRGFMYYLLQESWVKNYYFSDNMDSEALAKDSVLILSKYPFTVSEHIISVHKRLLIANLMLNDKAIHIATIHLTSDYGNNAPEKRKQQLQLVFDFMNVSGGDSIILGDFNARLEEQTILFENKNYIDVWAKNNPNDTLGFTHQPALNPLAALFSLSQEGKRIDAIYVKSEHWNAQKTELFANQVIPNTDNLYCSDHFAIATILEFNNMQTETIKTTKFNNITPSYQSAIVWIPPQNAWKNIQELRAKYDSKYQRWMPHITLIYGFIPETMFAEAAPIIAEAVAKIAPFSLEFADFQTFEHRGSVTAWLQPNAQATHILQQLQATLQALFPSCNEQSTKEKGFTPHLSIGQFKTTQEAKKVLPTWKPLQTEVQNIALISREKDTPFTIKYIVEIGTNKCYQPVPEWQKTIDNYMPTITLEQENTRKTALNIVEQACSDVLKQPIKLQLIGSAKLGIVSPNSDIDAVCAIPIEMNRFDFLQQVAAILKDFCSNVRLVEDAQVPILKVTLDTIPIDILAANYPYFPNEIDTTLLKNKTNIDALSWQSLAGILEAEILLKTAKNWVTLDTFRTYIRAIRAWAKARQIVGNGWGFLGSFSWTILATNALHDYCKQEMKPTLEGFLKHFFKIYAAHDWKKPIGLTAQAKEYKIHSKRDQMPIITSIEPCFNSAKNITHSTFEVLKEEFNLANSIAKKASTDADWISLFKPVQAGELIQNNQIKITLEAKNKQDLEQCTGWLEGNFVGLLIDLEQERDVFARFIPNVQNLDNQAVLTIHLQTNKDILDKIQISIDAFITKFGQWTTKPKEANLSISLVNLF